MVQIHGERKYQEKDKMKSLTGTLFRVSARLFAVGTFYEEPQTQLG